MRTRFYGWMEKDEAALKMGEKSPQVCCVNSRKKEGSGFIVKWC